jgi:hypothetical protein
MDDLQQQLDNLWIILNDSTLFNNYHQMTEAERGHLAWLS